MNRKKNDFETWRILAGVPKRPNILYRGIKKTKEVIDDVKFKIAVTLHVLFLHDFLQYARSRKK